MVKRRKKKMNRKAAPLAQIIRMIASSPSLSKIASLAVKDDVDHHVYGYEKYSLHEIASELRERLYNPTYLGCAVAAILESPKANNPNKTYLARNYLDVVASYLNGEMPKKTYEYWGSDAEPSYVVESAAYLLSQSRTDWITNERYLKGILSFRSDSSVVAKKSLLRAMVERINQEYRERRSGRGRSLIDLLSNNDDIVVDSLLVFLKETGARTPGEEIGEDYDSRRKLQLVSNLSSLIDAQGDESSAGELCKLSCIGKDDLTKIFTSVPLSPFLRHTPSNRTLLYYDMGKVLCQERNVPFSSIVQALARELHLELERSKRVIYYADEPKLKALCKLAVEIGENKNAELLTLVQEVIRLKGVETETRLVLFRFLYDNLDNEVKRNMLLQEASRFKSSKIKAWASCELNAPTMMKLKKEEKDQPQKEPAAEKEVTAV